jgi:hypothetical protein
MQGKYEKFLSILLRKLEGKRLFWRRSCGWEDNINMDLKTQDVAIRTIFIWIRIESSDRLLWTR